MYLLLLGALLLTGHLVDGQGDPGPKICRENEVWRQCGSCEATCENTEDTPCTHRCIEPRCECPRDLGFVRTNDGRCVHRLFCPRIQQEYLARCHHNEIWHECGGCEASCSLDQNVVCAQICLEARCECPRELGFARLENGHCVPRWMCPVPDAAVKEPDNAVHIPPPPPDVPHGYRPNLPVPRDAIGGQRPPLHHDDEILGGQRPVIPHRQPDVPGGQRPPLHHGPDVIGGQRPPLHHGPDVIGGQRPPHDHQSGEEVVGGQRPAVNPDQPRPGLRVARHVLGT